nr:hypothetical protein GCM10020092_005790 [Actinoplanes digitatis]
MDLFHQPIPELPGVPRALTEILRYGMANDPRARPTAAQLRELLTGLHLGPAGGQPAPTIYRASTFQPPVPRPMPLDPRPRPPVSPTRDVQGEDETPTVHTDPRKRGKRKWLFGGFGVFLLLAASVGGALLASSQGPKMRSLAELALGARRLHRAGRAVPPAGLRRRQGVLPRRGRVLHPAYRQRPDRAAGRLLAAAQLGGLRHRRTAERRASGGPDRGHRRPDRAQGVQPGDVPPHHDPHRQLRVGAVGAAADRRGPGVPVPG